MNNILDALSSLNVADLSYQEWINVGMALKREGFPVQVWDSWSRNDPRYKDGLCEKKWRTFGSCPSPVTGGTIVQMAKDRGWKPSHKGPMAFDDVIEYDGDEDYSSPVLQLRTYLETLFEPDEYVSYVTGDVWKDDDGKYFPKKGVYRKTAKQIIDALDKYPGDLGAAVGDWKDEAGAWIRFNPVDGKGIKNENVTACRYTLVESDTMSIDEQYKAYTDLNLPIAALVFSGGKSLHAIVRINASSPEQFRDRVDFLYSYLEKKGLTLDKQNRNLSRLSRMPGVTRNGKVQRLVAVNLGPKDWESWIETLDESDDGLPNFLNLADAAKDPPPLLPVLIDGVLRCGHKMIIAGASKAGKSFLLLELVIAIAEGLEWLGFKCRQGKVLYINLEIDPASCINRLLKIYEALGIEQKHMENIVIWNLRGKALPLDKLSPKLIRRMENKGYTAFVLDPIYKVITGDENNASDMGAFCNEFDKVCEATGASAIYCHHHSKGGQAEKDSKDRASGSGVFARDPDAILDMIQLDLSDDVKNNVVDDDETGWRLTGDLREFKNFKPRNFWFKYPIHVLDKFQYLEGSYVHGSKQANLAKSPKRTTREQRRDRVDAAFEALQLEPKLTVKKMADYTGCTELTMRRYINESYSDKYMIKNGIVSLIGPRDFYH